MIGHYKEIYNLDAASRLPLHFQFSFFAKGNSKWSKLIRRCCHGDSISVPGSCEGSSWVQQASQFNPSKTEWLENFGSPRAKDPPSFVLDGVALPLTAVGGPLGFKVLLEEQIVASYRITTLWATLATALLLDAIIGAGCSLFKALPSLGPGYLWEGLFLVVSIHPA